MRKIIFPLFAIAALAACDHLPTLPVAGEGFGTEREAGSAVRVRGVIHRSAPRIVAVERSFTAHAIDRIELRNGTPRADVYFQFLDDALRDAEAVCVTALVKSVYRTGRQFPELVAYNVDRLDVHSRAVEYPGRPDASRIPTPLACREL